YCGATPVFADILGPHDLSLDPDDVERRITDRTRAVSVVHFAGYPAPVERLRALTDAHGIALVEDAAHSPDAHVDGRMLGTWGLAGAFSILSHKALARGARGRVQLLLQQGAGLRRGRAAGHRRRRRGRARALAAQPGDDVRLVEPLHR